MSLGMYVLDRSGRQTRYFSDDVNNSFMRICESAPPESVRSGVMKYGDTMFNRNQLVRLIEELEALEGGPPAVVIDILDAARYAWRESLYLFIRGD
ncbi:hypothetical protein [Streptomyces griseoaurantiacus]|uniref:hypothetical protein n=1 Tax=Streptomyces griseoaurantiacus TaxID=68213 RepID=UPI002E2A1A9B|nr:hypothetical protein [Streptomyces jietaisiensis]